MLSQKIILVGDFSTGKTSLIRRFVDDQFSETYITTIGVKISKKSIGFSNGSIEGFIWDIEGCTERKPLNRTYLKGANCCILVADTTREVTISHIATYILTLKKISPSIPLILVLNKSDKLNRKEKEKIFANVLKQYCDQIKVVYFSSAKNGEGVEDVFKAAMQDVQNFLTDTY